MYNIKDYFIFDFLALFNSLLLLLLALWLLPFTGFPSSVSDLKFLDRSSLVTGFPVIELTKDLKDLSIDHHFLRSASMACFVSFFNQLNDTEYHLSGFLILPDCCIAFCVSLIDAIIIRVIKLFHTRFLHRHTTPASPFLSRKIVWRVWVRTPISFDVITTCTISVTFRSPWLYSAISISIRHYTIPNLLCKLFSWCWCCHTIAT